MKKQFNRLNQVVSQTLGRSEKSEVLSEELQLVDQRIDAMVNALEHTRKKLTETLRSRKSASLKEEVSMEKRQKLLDEHKLSQAIITDAKSIENVFDKGLLSEVMSNYGKALNGITDEIIQYEMQMEQHVLEKMTKFADELKAIGMQKEKLKKVVLDMDSAKTRLSAAQSRGERTTEVQDELDQAQLKVDSCKDTLASEMYTLASKEVDMAVLFRVLLQIQMDFHRSALNRLLKIEPEFTQRIDMYARRPVYGCPLEDHLRYSKREVAWVLEVCCAALSALGLKDEGLFRIPGNSTKVRRLKAAFDAGEVDLNDFERDPHSFAGALKSYLRELPDPLMTNNLYKDWMSAMSITNAEQRLTAIRAVIEKLPQCNRSNLRYLVKFLARLVENQQFTKMSSQNLAIVMAPNMIWSPLEGEGFGLNNAHGTLVELLISNANYFFPGDVRFSSADVSLLVEKTGGFLENGPTQPAALSVNVASQQSFRMNPDDIDAPISPSRLAAASASRRPKHPAPPPPPTSSIPLLDHHKRTNSGGGSNSGAYADDTASGHYEFDDWTLSDEENSDAGVREKPDQDSYNPSGALRKSVPPQPAHAAAGNEFTASHRKTNSLDRPIRPPPCMATIETKDQKSMIQSASLERPAKNGLDKSAGIALGGAFQHELLTSADLSDKQQQDFGDSTLKSSTLPRHQPSRPPLPSKEKAVSKNPMATTVRIDPSDESEDDEPVITETDGGHIYYDVPSLAGNYRKVESPPPMQKKQPTAETPQPAARRAKQQDALQINATAESGDSTVNVAQRRQSLMKLFVENQQQNLVPPRPRPPIPSKPRSVESPDKDVIRF